MAIRQHIFKRYMTYDGKRYEISVIRHRKDTAEKIAASLRNQGFSARVADVGFGIAPYAVYKRRA